MTSCTSISADTNRIGLCSLKVSRDFGVFFYSLFFLCTYSTFAKIAFHLHSYLATCALTVLMVSLLVHFYLKWFLYCPYKLFIHVIHVTWCKNEFVYRCKYDVLDHIFWWSLHFREQFPCSYLLALVDTPLNDWVQVITEYYQPNPLLTAESHMAMPSAQANTGSRMCNNELFTDFRRPPSSQITMKFLPWSTTLLACNLIDKSGCGGCQENRPPGITQCRQ